MRSLRRVLLLFALGAACLITAGGLAGESRAATTLDGAWSGAGHLLQVSSSLEGGFSISAGESWTLIGCPISSPTVLSSYSPKGGGSYEATHLWTENTT